MSNVLLGQEGEEIANNYLKKKGYIIKERNFKRKWGEIDIVAFDKKTKEWVFVEVKTRKMDNFNKIQPEEELTPEKIKKLKKIILSYLCLKGLEQSKWRFDFIGIEIGNDKTLPKIRHYQSEFLEYD
jgi:putative endonuclease